MVANAIRKKPQHSISVYIIHINVLGMLVQLPSGSRLRPPSQLSKGSSCLGQSSRVSNGSCVVGFEPSLLGVSVAWAIGPSFKHALHQYMHANVALISSIRMISNVVIISNIRMIRNVVLVSCILMVSTVVFVSCIRMVSNLGFVSSIRMVSNVALV
jgi:hypothetical protein